MLCRLLGHPVLENSPAAGQHWLLSALDLWGAWLDSGRVSTKPSLPEPTLPSSTSPTGVAAELDTEFLCAAVTKVAIGKGVFAFL